MCRRAQVSGTQPLTTANEHVIGLPLGDVHTQENLLFSIKHNNSHDHKATAINCFIVGMLQIAGIFVIIGIFLLSRLRLAEGVCLPFSGARKLKRMRTRLGKVARLGQVVPCRSTVSLGFEPPVHPSGEP